MKIAVVGMGYIGLPTALMFANVGMKVVGIDCEKKRVEALQAGEIELEEGVETLMASAIKNGIEFTTEYREAQVYIVAVPTPYVRESKCIDASAIVSAVKDILRVSNKEIIICIESTMAPGTIDEWIRPLIREYRDGGGCSVHLVHAPERVMPGNTIYELIHNTRVIGCDYFEVGEQIRRLYATFCIAEIIITDIHSAEMIKIAENTFRDMNIAYANELLQICNQADLDVYEIIRIANKHPRVQILQPGPGVGGHCISVDPWFLVGKYPQFTRLILTARQVNEEMPRVVIRKMGEIMKECRIMSMEKVGLYGLSYKEDIGDFRESPSFQLLNLLEENLAFGMKCYDPFVKEIVVNGQCETFDQFLESVDFVVIMVGHTQIKENIEKLKGKIVLDTRNVCHLAGVYKL